MKAEEFYKIYVYDITKRITPNDAIELMELYANEVSRERACQFGTMFPLLSLSDKYDDMTLPEVYDLWIKEQEEKK